MTKREKILMGAVGGTVAVLLNIFLLSFFIKNRRALDADLALKQAQYKGMQQLLADRAMWEQRATKLAAVQPKLENQAMAGSLLLDEVKAVAKRHAVLIKPETLSIGSVERRPHCTAVPVNIETMSTWEALVKFLLELQGPEKFIVLEDASFRKDTTDPTQMTAKFRIAKWFAPET
jgi:hypothetical protein